MLFNHEMFNKVKKYVQETAPFDNYVCCYLVYDLCLFLYFMFDKCIYVLCSLISGVRKVLIVGDSIVKNVVPFEGARVLAFQGATINRLASLFDNNKIFVGDAEYLILHVGTNDVNNG